MIDRRAILIVLFGLTPSVVADDDPIVRGRKVSEWFQFIRSEQDSRRRLAALQLIDSEAGVKVSAVFPALAKEMREHPDPVIRAKIASLMPKYRERGEELVSALKSVLAQDAEGAVRESAATSLGKLERLGFTAIAELQAALRDAHVGTRAAAAEAIGLFSRIDPELAKDSVPVFCELLTDANRAVRLNSAFALGRMGKGAASAASALAGAFANEQDAMVRKEVAKTLAELGSQAGEAGPVLASALTDPQPEIRQAAALALGRIKPDAATVLPALLKAARDSDKSVRCLAVHAIGAQGKAAISAIPDLIDILKRDEVAEVRLAAIEELARFGSDAMAAVEALKVASRDGRPTIREAAQEALKKIQSSP